MPSARPLEPIKCSFQSAPSWADHMTKRKGQEGATQRGHSTWASGCSISIFKDFEPLELPSPCPETADATTEGCGWPSAIH